MERNSTPLIGGHVPENLRPLLNLYPCIFWTLLSLFFGNITIVSPFLAAITFSNYHCRCHHRIPFADLLIYAAQKILGLETFPYVRTRFQQPCVQSTLRRRRAFRHVWCSSDEYLQRPGSIFHLGSRPVTSFPFRTMVTWVPVQTVRVYQFLIHFLSPLTYHDIMSWY